MNKPDTSPPRCVDCTKAAITTKRKATRVGNQPYLCASHRRARRTARRDYSWERHIKATYGLTPQEYWALYDAQEGKCYICGRPRARDRKKLSVDHCHKTGRIRGLLDQQCNRDVLGHLRDDISAFERGKEYLINPPAFAVIGERIVPTHEVNND
ncbi:endonuclease VII domain-containing protein [Nocardia brasiliensis]|uniref:endonuclease VII domain-containing protein n=1 Tax=Nocardia brasiliensis TaxID=37326 RepID=UPI0024566445|nr:endonuclease VII domain-containing protein [Nocardia brasiliensis]